MKKSFKRIGIIFIALLIVIAIVLYFITLVTGKVIDLAEVVELTVYDEGVNKTYTGQSAINYLNNINKIIKVKKGYYVYNEIEHKEQVLRNDLAKRVTEKYENRSKKIIGLDFNFNVTQPWLINYGLETKYREVIIKELGVQWSNTYSMSASIKENIPIGKSAHIEFYPLMEYSHGYIEHWYEYAKDSKIKICLEKKEIETYSPKYLENNGSRVLSGEFYVVYEDLKN